ncbi:MAG: trimethylamine methyltransferase family protein, partial [Rhodospirillaceae bacterium]|nr:trimethylamine methyltransferase family protein [Rhodospirillaceae bacterium]
MSLWPVVLSHAHFIVHGFGWLEGGLCASYEKFILDAEMVQMMQEFLKPLDTAEAELGLDAIAEVGPGGHFFGCNHTMARYETAFYRPMLSDWRNFETWQDSGAVEASDRATKIWKQLLADYEAPPLDPAISEELDAFVARRIAEGGAPER